MEYLIVYTKFKKIMTAFESCGEKEKNDLIQEFKESGTFKGEIAESMKIYKLDEQVGSPGR